jgi:hypothetical protein
MPKPQLSIRELLLLLTVAGFVLGWSIDHYRLTRRQAHTEDLLKVALYGQNLSRKILDEEAPGWRERWHTHWELPTFDELREGAK